MWSDHASLAPGNLTPDAIDNHFVVASASFRLNDPFEAARTYQTLLNALPGAENELRTQVVGQLSALAPELRVLSDWRPGEPVRLELLGTPQQNYVIYSSSNLAQWTPISTNWLDSNRVEIADVSLTNAARYYRAVWTR